MKRINNNIDNEEYNVYLSPIDHSPARHQHFVPKHEETSNLYEDPINTEADKACITRNLQLTEACQEDNKYDIIMSNPDQSSIRVNKSDVNRQFNTTNLDVYIYASSESSIIKTNTSSDKVDMQNNKKRQISESCKHSYTPITPDIKRQKVQISNDIISDCVSELNFELPSRSKPNYPIFTFGVVKEKLKSRISKFAKSKPTLKCSSRLHSSNSVTSFSVASPRNSAKLKNLKLNSDQSVAFHFQHLKPLNKFVAESIKEHPENES